MMFEVVQAHKHSRQEIQAVVLECMAATGILGIVATLAWMLFFRGGG